MFFISWFHSSFSSVYVLQAADGGISVTYIRWGKSSCPGAMNHGPMQRNPFFQQPMPGMGPRNPFQPHQPMQGPFQQPHMAVPPTMPRFPAQLVYEGVTAGSLSQQPGSGADPLCMPVHPSWGNFSDLHHHGGQIYGAEYRLGQHENVYNVFENTLLEGRLNRQRVPCAVCRVVRMSSVLMVPGINRCPTGWHQQYHGYLMSERYDSHKSQYICVDHAAEESRHGGGGMPGNTMEGMQLYPVEAMCGTLPCAPYVNHREMTCTVCTR